MNIIKNITYGIIKFLLSDTAYFIIYSYHTGGDVWGSNPPERLLTPHAGFEDRREHQNSSTPIPI